MWPVAAMTEYMPCLRAKLGTLLDAKERHLAGAPEDRKHRDLVEKVDRIVAPFAGGDHASVEGENSVELAAVETNLRSREALSAWVDRPRGRRLGRAEKCYGFFRHRPKCGPVMTVSQACNLA